MVDIAYSIYQKIKEIEFEGIIYYMMTYITKGNILKTKRWLEKQLTHMG